MSTLYNTPNTNNQAANVTKGNGDKESRKQQQKSSQSNASQSSGRKNGKTNGKNQNGKNWKQRLTSPRPLTTLSHKGRNKFKSLVEISLTSKTNTTTTVRPIKLSNNNGDNKDGEKIVYVKSAVKAPKQIKEIITAGSKINTRIDIRNESISTKKNAPSAPVFKSYVPKTTTASPYDDHVELVDTFEYTSNPNIPKLFQRYEKIQEFYPEFHPYVGLPKASSSINGNRGITAAGEPSRDGSKHNHTSSTSNQKSPPLTSAEISNSRSVDVSSVQKPSLSRIQSSGMISSTNGKG